MKSVGILEIEYWIIDSDLNSISLNSGICLRYIRAANRVWHDKYLTRECSVKVYKYFSDDYDKGK